jgi:SAM-dependent methyltransferase
VEEHPESLVFDRVAHEYDETRGGVARGRGYARTIARHVVGTGTLLEVGVGTGAIALPLAETGLDVVGVDLSRPMLARAHERLGNRVACADAHRLPVATGSVSDVVTVWVLHVVAEPERVVHEIARVLRPGGRWCSVSSDATSGTTDLDRVLHDFNRDTGRYRDAPDQVRDWCDAAGLGIVHEGHTETIRFEQSPLEAVAHIETRTMSSLWDLDEAAWVERVEPHLERLRALPRPDGPRQRTLAHPLTVVQR